MNKKKKKILAILLAISMVIPNVATANAEIGTPGDAEYVTEQTEKSTEDITEDITEEVTEEVTTEEISTEEITTQETTTEEVTTEDITTEEVTETEEKQPTFTSPVEGVDVSGIDFSSKQLLIGTEDENIFTWDTTVISAYNGIFLTEYGSEEETRNAYTYYYGKADFVDANITFTVSDDEDSKESEGSPKDTADLSEINTGDDAISNLNDMDTTGTVPAGTIAVIDTGINGEGLVDSVSVIGDSTSDDNGHGTRMYGFIKAEYPNAKVISIKALGSDGKGQVSDVYAAIQYAIAKKVSVINLSISAYSTADNDVIRTAIEEAVAQGIVVVGAAGNDGKNVRYFIPGNIDLAVIVGASDGNGQRIAGSNYGSTVDYNVEAESTSEAAAKMSAVIARNDGTNTSKIFTTDYDIEDATGDMITYTNSEFVIANWPGDGEPHTTTAYVQAYEIGTESAHHLKYKYYDSNNHVFDTGISFDFSEYGSVSGVNCFCLDPYAWAGRNGHEFDTDPLVEVTATSPSWVNTSLTTQQIQNVIYWALQEGGPWADDFVDYFFQYWMGRSPLMGDVSDNSSYETFVNNNKNNSVPYGKSFKVYFIHNTASTTAPNTYQDFLTWKLEDAVDYYVAVRKVDQNGRYLNNITFKIKINGEELKHRHTDGNFTASVYSGYQNGVSVDSSTGALYIDSAKYSLCTGTSTVGSNTSFVKDGIALVYLGKYSSAPTVQIAEAWNASTTATDRAYQKSSVESVTYPSGTRTTETVAFSKFNSVYSDYRTVTAKTSVEAALADADSNSNKFTDTRYEDYYIAVRKVDGNGYLMNGITFDVTVNGTKQSKQIETGKDYNGSAYVNGSKGIGGYYLGRFSSAPTVSVTENWVETWNKNHFAHDTSTKSPALKTSMADAKNNAAAYTYTNYSYGFATMHKESTGTVLSMDGIQYQLYRCINGSGTAVNTLIATVTLNTNGYIKSVSLADNNCWQETINGVICIGGLTYNPTPTTPITNNYYWVESATNSNYQLNTTKNYFTVNKSNATKPGTDDTKYPSVYTFTPASATGNDAPRAYVGIYKKDEQNRNVVATFDIYGTNTSGATSGGTKIGSITTSASNGKASYEVTSVYNRTTTNVNGKYRYFYAHETATDSGHYIGLPDKVLTVHDGMLADADYIPWINNTRPYVKLTKTSANPNCTNGNPNYSLVNTTFKMYKTQAEANTAKNSGNYGTALATITITASDITNNQGIKTLDVSQWMDKNADGSFKNTIFYFVESAAGKNYKRDTRTIPIQVTPSNTSTNPAQLNVANTPVNDPFEIEIMKTDKLTGSNVVPEGKSLAGATFAVDFYAADIETVLANANGNIAAYLKANYTPSTIYSTTVTVTKKTDGRYTANLAGIDFPIGFITITEVTPPTDYSLTDAKQYLNGNTDYDVTGNLAFATYGVFTNNNATWTPKTYHPYTATTLAQLTSSTGSKHGIDVSDSGVTFNIEVENTPVRGNLRLNKVRFSNGNPIKGVEFEVKNNATGETHTIVTDANGNATTVGNSNAWFSLLDDGTSIAYNADYGCLPAGTYTVTEKRCEANDGLQLLKPATVTINSTSTVLVAEADGKLYNIEMPEITTTARVVETDSKTLAQKGEAQTIEDVVAYKNLRADTTYTLVGQLMVRHPDGTYEAYKKNRTAYTVKKEFKTSAGFTKSEFEKSGTVTVNFEGIYAENYEGCSFVVFEKLYLGTNTTTAAQYPEYAGSDETIFPVVHENINDEGQTVRPIDIHTTIADAVADDHIAKTGDVTITDRVYYTGLTVDEYYTIKGTLHVTGYSWKDADGNLIKTTTVDGEELLDADGNPITAEKTFQAKSTDGYEDLEFTFDASLLEGESVIAFESIYYKDKEIAVHADLEDEDETVHFPMIHTTLYRGGTEEWAEDYDETDPTKMTTVDEASKEVMAAEEAVVVDRIKYHNLIAGRSYVVKGILVDKTTGEPLLDANGDKIEVEQKFTLDEVPEENITASPDAGDYILADGTVLDMSADHSIQLVDGYFEVTFPAFDASEMGNKTAVAFEEVYLLTTDTNGDEIEHLLAEHKDKDDVDQTVRFVEIHTNATVEETNTKIVPLEGPVTINDKVSYKNLIPDMEYSLTATPVVKGDVTGTYEDGDQLLDKNGKPVTATITFKPEKPDGEIVVPITFEGYLIPEIEIVCYETMTNYKGLDIAIHDDIDDEDQTVIVVKVSTTAKDSVTEDNESLATEETVIIDTVSYEGLEEGLTYLIVGTIMQRSTEKPVHDAEGNEITAEVEFVAEQSEGTIDITFPAFDSVGLALAGDSVVVFEKIYLVKEKKDDTDEDAGEDTTDILIGHHEDINDEGQTVNIPEIHTTAYDSETEDHVGTVGEKITIVDVVTYKNLKTEEYTVKGVLMDKETGKELLVDGKPVTAEKTFTPEKPDGTVELEFTLDSTALAGTSTIVFENIYRNGKLAGVHNSLEDKDQEIDFPKVRTKAEDAVTKQDIGKTSTTTTIIDTVFYTNLHVGDNKEYTVKGVLMDRDTGKELLVDGKPVTAEKTFIPEKPDGTIELEFTFDGSALNGEVIVVFEDLYRNKKLVYNHGSLTDTEQTVYYPSVHTHVEDTTKTVQKVNDVTVKDDVMYSKIKIGQTYMLEGVLMDKKTGKAVMVNGLPVKVQRTFTAEAEDGMITMEFHFDASELEGDVTVFEYLYLVKDKDNKNLTYTLVAEHTDLNDKEQTFMISPVPKTADDTPVMTLFGILLLSGLGLAYIVLKKKNMISR